MSACIPMTPFRRKVLPALIVFVLLLIVGGVLLSRKGAAPATAPLTAEEAEALAIPALSPRLVSLSPAITEILCMLGLGDHLVGRTEACDFPAAVTNAPVVLDASGALSFERLAATLPDRVLLPEALAGTPLREELAKRRINHIGVRLDSLNDIYQSIFDLAVLFDVEDNAAAWLSGMEKLSADLRGQCAAEITRAGGVSPAFLIVLGRLPATDGKPARLIVAGRRCFQQGILEALGARNVMEEDAPYVEISMVRAAQLAPAVIVEIAPRASTGEEQLQLLLDWAAVPDCPAVATENIRILSEPFALRPGPRLDRLFLLFARCISDWASSGTPAAAVPAASKEAAPAVP